MTKYLCIKTLETTRPCESYPVPGKIYTASEFFVDLDGDDVCHVSGCDGVYTKKFMETMFTTLPDEYTDKELFKLGLKYGVKIYGRD